MVPIKSLLYSRVVLYILCILALVNVVMYANVKDVNSIVTLLLIGGLVSVFSKNMIVILGVAISLTYLLNYTSIKMINEGAENMKEDEKPEDEIEGIDENLEDAATKEESTDKKPKEKSTEDADKKKLYDSLQADFKDFQKIQDSILSGMKEIDPLLTKAESFIEKFEHYGKKLEESKE
tara:strand:- start:53 stop:589 length:537 start_codon:yes stop_codon:yes gene_type:complete